MTGGHPAVNEVPERAGDGHSARAAGRRRWSIAWLGAPLIGSLIIAGMTNAAANPRPGPIGHPGLFDAGQPLYCSGVQAMSPPVGDQYLEARGYTVTWQVENRDAMTSQLTDTPPETGHIIEGVLHDQHLLLVVEVGERATPANIPTCG